MNSLDVLAPLSWEDLKLHETERSTFAKFLNVICVKTPEKDSEEDVILQPCEVKLNCHQEDYSKNAMHNYARSLHCSNWNDYLLNCLNGDMNDMCIS